MQDRNSISPIAQTDEQLYQISGINNISTLHSSIENVQDDLEDRAEEPVKVKKPVKVESPRSARSYEDNDDDIPIKPRRIPPS